MPCDAGRIERAGVVGDEDPVYGSDRTGGSMSWLARDSVDHDTLWAATPAERFPSGIYVEPSDPGHAWISYSGYNAATPTTPGHVFEDG